MKVARLQAEMANLPQLALETAHYFADGMYARVVARPKGSVIIGKVHKREHFYVVTKGSIRVSDGATWREYHAGDVIVSKPGTKRAVLALEDSICMTVHRTFETDIEAIERELVEDDPTSMYAVGNTLKTPLIGEGA